MAQQGKIEFSFWYSLAKWHRTVDRQPAAMRTCLKTAGKGNSTYCLQTWTHMSENAQNIAFFTRFVGAESAGLSMFNQNVIHLRKLCASQGVNDARVYICSCLSKNKTKHTHISLLHWDTFAPSSFHTTTYWQHFFCSMTVFTPRLL